MKPAIVPVVLLLLVSTAHAQVSCDDPDNLCTGDPCVIENVDVLSPCIVDFGSRTVVIQGKVKAVFANSSYEVSFTAGSIVVDAGGEIEGGPVTLTASGPIDLDGR